MTRYRRQRNIGDNLRDLYSQIQQILGSGMLGDSSIDDEGSLDIIVSDDPDDEDSPYTTVARYGHNDDSTKHGFLVPHGSDWRTVQEDAQARADAAEADAKTYTDSKTTALDGRLDAAEGDIDTLQSQMTNRTSRINALENQVDNIGDAQSAMASTVNSVRNEVQNARGGYGSLNARLTAIENALGL